MSNREVGTKLGQSLESIDIGESTWTIGVCEKCLLFLQQLTVDSDIIPILWPEIELR